MDDSRGEGSEASTSGGNHCPSKQEIWVHLVTHDCNIAPLFKCYCSGRPHSAHLTRCQKLQGASWRVWKHLTLCLRISLHLTSSKPVCKFHVPLLFVCESHPTAIYNVAETLNLGGHMHVRCQPAADNGFKIICSSLCSIPCATEVFLGEDLERRRAEYGCGCAVNDLMRKSPLLRGDGLGAGTRFSGGRLSAEEANMACQHDPGRGPPIPCKFFILDVSEIAQELGLPTCSDVSIPLLRLAGGQIAVLLLCCCLVTCLRGWPLYACWAMPPISLTSERAERAQREHALQCVLCTTCCICRCKAALIRELRPPFSQAIKVSVQRQDGQAWHLHKNRRWLPH